ncbi:Chalcone-flavanone isomerase family protein [Quillaja saponaria]|uniref:Chalcone-flavanone isomerase family protein n=1 Tax=Quillaja saponaria TaxID=32244 RepID=A0AAD7KSJ4_QUISA|nr:Chalcone-flavanone isomerase family protein [Quillaja saponaria]
METPSSTRRVTRSQALAALSSNSNSNSNIPLSKKIDSESEKGLSKSRPRNGKQQDRSALFDITNDSPIVGVASGGLETPSSAIAKQRGSRAKNTPGSGEALLRGQAVPFFIFRVWSILLWDFLPRTPVNTPQIPNLSDNGSMINNAGLASTTSLPIVEEHLISQVLNNMFEGHSQKSVESQKSLITRSLLLDFSDKSEISDSSECSSVLTYQEALAGGSESKGKSSTEDDDASIWSIQINASNRDEDEEEVNEEEGEEEEEEEEEEYYYENDDDNGGLVAELCEGISKISVNEKLPKFSGKHTRFVYNSADELAENEDDDDSSVSSPNVLHLKGLPTPKGKHLRFLVEEEEQEDE